MSRRPFPGAPPPIPPALRRRQPMSPQAQQEQFSALRASLLYCPKCKTATPARERLLLVLPSGNLYEYLCSECGTSTGEKTDQAQDQEVKLIKP
ncbi:MAG: hypothetical protein MRJ96_13435 [Nitrospirales bacterium]|nr:hypothetical protein [Nitrospira sp.]MDR4502447.1 hypothetical protein [Nitrospirales bacterium]